MRDGARDGVRMGALWRWAPLRLLALETSEEAAEERPKEEKKDKGKQRARQEEEDDEEEDSPRRKQTKKQFKRRVPDCTDDSSPVASPSKAIKRPRPEPDHSDSDSDSNSSGLFGRAAPYKANNAYFQDRNGAHGRKRWRQAEVDLFVSEMEKYGPDWGRVIARHGSDGRRSRVLKYRNNVSLKDKARNLAIDYIRREQPRPVYLEGGESHGWFCRFGRIVRAQLRRRGLTEKLDAVFAVSVPPKLRVLEEQTREKAARRAAKRAAKRAAEEAEAEPNGAGERADEAAAEE